MDPGGDVVLWCGVTVSTVAVYLAGVLAAYAMTDQSLMTLLMGWYMWRQLYGQKVSVSLVSGVT